MFDVVRVLGLYLNNEHHMNDAHYEALNDITCGRTRPGYRIVIHMPLSSSFKPKEFDTWEKYWEAKSNQKFPASDSICDCCFERSSLFVGCHVVDIRTKEAFIYPVCQSCNARAIRHELDYPFYAKEDLLVPFRVAEANVVGRSESPEELLIKALSSIEFDYFPPDMGL